MCRLWLSKTSSKSCDQAIFVDLATDASVSSDAVLLKIDRRAQLKSSTGTTHITMRP